MQQSIVYADPTANAGSGAFINVGKSAIENKVSNMGHIAIFKMYDGIAIGMCRTKVVATDVFTSNLDTVLIRKRCVRQ